MESFFLNCSFYGETATVVAIMAVFYWCIDKKLGEYLLISFCGTNFVTSFLKNAACIYRPWIMDSGIHPVEEALPGATGYSFPSGHATNSTSLFGGLILRGNYSKALSIVFAVCILLICFSRLYLSVHSVLDVVVGIVLTIIVLVVFSRLFDMLEERPNLDIIISAVGLVIMAAVFVFSLTKSYPLDYDAAGKLIVDPAVQTLGTFYCMGITAGLLVSWPIERRFINFSSDGTTEAKILRCICGVIAIGLISKVIMPVIGFESPLQSFMGTFILGLFVMLIYPAAIKFFQNRSNS